MSEPVEPVHTQVEADLSERVALAADSSDALHRVLEELLRADDVERAMVVVRRGDAVRSEGFGFPPEAVRAAADATTPLGIFLAEVIDEGERRSPSEAARRQLGEGDFVAIPFPGARGIPAGCALLEGDPPPETTAGLRRAGPVLARIHEAEVLRHRSERSERRNMLLSTIVDSLFDPVVLTDHQNNFLYANQRAEQLFSSKPQESEGRRRAIRINDLLFSSFLTQAVIGDEPSSRELNLVDPGDGSDFLFEVITVPLPPDVKEEGGVISVLRDISDLKRALTELEVQFNRSRVAEQSARRESDRMNVIIANVGDPILVTDSDSKIILMNSEAERLFDASALEEDDGKTEPPRMRAVRANDTRFTTLIADFLLQERARRVENMVIDDPAAGEELPVEVVSSKIFDQRGEVSAIVSVLHDLTQVVENERLARELQILNEGLEERIRLATEELEERNRRLEWQSRELQKASRLKTEFLASMSHELRTPINAMLGYTALLREEIYGELNEKQENALRKVYGASQHLLALINDILDLSKIEAGRMPLRIEEVRIEAVVQELAQTIEPLVRDKELDFDTHLSEDLPGLKTDRTKVKQILLNLLSNAVKFTQEGGVTLRAEPLDDGKRIRIEVEDTGIGIRDEDRQTIFDDFRQADQSSTRKYGGTGLGLSITRRLSELMGGSISVDSVYGEGSTFTVELPTEVVLPPDGPGEAGRTAGKAG